MNPEKQVLIEECVKNGILREYLGRKTREVMNMLIAEYDYAADMAVQRQEAWEDAWDKASKELPEKTLKQTALNMLKDKVSIDAVSKYTGLSPEVILKLQQEQ